MISERLRMEIWDLVGLLKMRFSYRIDWGGFWCFDEGLWWNVELLVIVVFGLKFKKENFFVVLGIFEFDILWVFGVYEKLFSRGIDIMFFFLLIEVCFMLVEMVCVILEEFGWFGVVRWGWWSLFCVVNFLFFFCCCVLFKVIVL